jgi:hypothetical protein
MNCVSRRLVMAVDVHFTLIQFCQYLCVYLWGWGGVAQFAKVIQTAGNTSLPLVHLGAVTSGTAI